MPAKLNLDKVRPSDRYEKTSPEEPSRRPSRAASATPSRGFSQRDQMQPPSRMRRAQQEEEDSYAGELYDMYGGPAPNRNSRGQRSQRGAPAPRYIQEEDEESDYDVSFDEGEFEMVSGRRPSSNTVRSSGGRGSSRRPELRSIRVKVHAGDVRYIMVGTAIEFPDFEEKIRSKFGIRRRIKIKIKDEDAPDGDMITVGDQDDLDMLIQTVKQNARKQKLETGKMEVCLPLGPCPAALCTNNINRSGSRRYRTISPFRFRYTRQLYPRADYHGLMHDVTMLSSSFLLLFFRVYAPKLRPHSRILFGALSTDLYFLNMRGCALHACIEIPPVAYQITFLSSHFCMACCVDIYGEGVGYSRKYILMFCGVENIGFVALSLMLSFWSYPILLDIKGFFTNLSTLCSPSFP